MGVASEFLILSVSNSAVIFDNNDAQDGLSYNTGGINVPDVYHPFTLQLRHKEYPNIKWQIGLPAFGDNSFRFRACNNGAWCSWT